MRGSRIAGVGGGSGTLWTFSKTDFEELGVFAGGGVGPESVLFRFAIEGIGDQGSEGRARSARMYARRVKLSRGRIPGRRLVGGKNRGNRQ